ncbi:hypothetical protein B0H14DRAFT_2572251 [Mycena olivaceomarginata]|nr:hypothetical protein B0H14DRAFT_2572251 [Mycena olivaceomarginata]
MQNQKEPARGGKKIVSQRSKCNAWAVADVTEPTRTELTEQSNKRSCDGLDAAEGSRRRLESFSASTSSVVHIIRIASCRMRPASNRKSQIARTQRRGPNFTEDGALARTGRLDVREILGTRDDCCAARLKSGAEVGRTMDSETQAGLRSLSTQRQGYHASTGRRGHSVECLSGVHEISKVCLHTSTLTTRIALRSAKASGRSKPGETIVNSSAVNTSPARRLRLRSISTFGIKFALQGFERGIENSKRGAQAELNALDISTKSGPPDQKDTGTET